MNHLLHKFLRKHPLLRLKFLFTIPCLDAPKLEALSRSSFLPKIHTLPYLSIPDKFSLVLKEPEEYILTKGRNVPSPHLATPMVKASVDRKMHKSAMKVTHPFSITIES